MITRLRPAHTPERLAQIYAEPHDHRRWGHGHYLRVEEMKAHARAVTGIKSVVDLSCGNGEVARSLGFPDDKTILGDFAPGYPICGPVEATIQQVPRAGVKTRLMISGETLEHLDDPAAVLAAFRKKAGRLVLSTPIDNFGDSNAEHYWAWDQAGVEELMSGAGWTVDRFTDVDSREFGEPYRYGIWTAH